MPRALLTHETFQVKETDLPVAAPIDLDADVVYTLRSISVAKGREIVNRHTRKVPDPRTRRMVDEIDELAAQDEMLDYALVGWEGVELDGVPVPCEGEHKRDLPGVIQVALVQRAQAGRTGSASAESFRQSA